MESLLATYTSSDEEDEQVEHSSNPSQFLSSLPPPKSSSLFSLPPPKSQSKPSSSLFSILPPPKTDPKPKRVVQFRPPVNPFASKSNIIDEEDDEDEDEDEKEKKRKKSESFTQTPSVKSFLSSIPAPKNSTSLGVLGSGSAGRRSTIDADVPVPVPVSNSDVSSSLNDVVVDSNTWYDDQSQQVDVSLQVSTGGDYTNWDAQGYVNNEGYANDDGATDHAGYGGNYGTYTGYDKYGNNNWTDGGSSAIEASGITETAEVALRLPGKRGRKDTPPQMIEVSQDELMKNRPREDQTRLTGIAFGPSYQPVSSKGKPSKLLKRKHQISTLYFDMKQKEMELTERRAKGMQTKAQTQGKYGW